MAGKGAGVNWSIAFCTVLFWIEENIYFGWNGVPKSDAELIADGIVFVLIALSVVRRPA